MLGIYAVLIGFTCLPVQPHAVRLHPRTRPRLFHHRDHAAARRAPWKRTDRVIRKASEILLARPGVANNVTFAGFDGATFTNAPNSGVIFATLKPFAEREKAGPDDQRHPGRLERADAERCRRLSFW